MKRFFSFAGRAPRKEYILIYLPIAAVAFLVGFLQSPLQMDLRFLLYPIGALMLPVTVRRLHDVGYSGWLVIAVAIIPLISLILLLVPSEGGTNAYGPSPHPTAPQEV